jgi:hypothetical protein
VAIIDGNPHVDVAIGILQDLYLIAVDSAGNAYVTGYTGSTNFPTANPLQPTYGGGSSDAFVAKLNPSGSALVYSTYLGGRKLDTGYGIAVDSTGNAYIMGYTQSTDFPVTPGAFRKMCNSGCGDTFVAKINSAGSALAYSTYLGGGLIPNNPDETGGGIAVDGAGNAYVTGGTGSTDFPVTPGAFQTTCNGGSNCAADGDAFVSKLNPTGSALVYSTYLGGSNSDFGSTIAVDSAGSAYVTGYTGSTNFPTANPLQPTYGGGSSDAFVAKLSPSGSSMVYSTYLGGSELDGGNGIAVDGSGNAYLAGITSSTDFPTMNPLQSTSGGGGYDAFVAKLSSPSKSATTTTLASSLNPSIYGQAVTWTATVTTSGSVAPTGKVNFTWDGYSIGTAALNSSGVATLTKSNLNADSYPLTARYVGDANNASGASSILSQVVTEATSAATLTSSPNPSTLGQSVTFTATLTSPTVAVTGPLTFSAGKTVLGTAQLSGGKATLTISSLAVGSTKVTVTYYGDSNIAKSSASVIQTVQ